MNNEEDIHAAQARFVEEGYEGAMVRNLKGAYRIGKRSADLQKVKTFLDDEFEIVGFTQGTGGETGCVVWVCKTSSGDEFSVRPRGTREERQEYFRTEMLTSQYAYGEIPRVTDDGIPRFPIGISIRDYE